MNQSDKKTVLVVEDDPNTAALVALYLEREGFRPLTAGDGETGLALAERHKPSMVILDLMLPKMDGWEVCRQIRQKSDMPVIMLTARSDEIGRVSGLTLGADDYLVKPFSPREKAPDSQTSGDQPGGDRFCHDHCVDFHRHTGSRLLCYPYGKVQYFTRTRPCHVCQRRPPLSALGLPGGRRHLHHAQFYHDAQGSHAPGPHDCHQRSNCGRQLQKSLQMLKSYFM
jgi:CheY-like chemotaxis protein